MANANACVFCGRSDGNITKEHIFAAWVDAIFPDAAQEKARVVLSRPKTHPIEYETRPFEQQVRVVCSCCNNGWMNRLETTAGGILGPMVGSTAATDLSPTVQRTIAAWATKTAFMLEHLHPANRIVPDSEYHRFYAIKQPPPEYMVFLAHRTSIIDPETGTSNLVTCREQEVNAIPFTTDVTREEIRASIDLGAKIYRVSFALGFLVIVVLGHTFPNPMNLVVTPNGEQVVRCIWPIQPRSMWPAAWPIERIGGFEALHNAFDPSAHPLPGG